MKILLVILSVFLFTTVSISQWERTNGPEGMSINSLASVGNVLYAGTKADGIYASTDEGNTWHASNSGIETKNITVITSINDTLLAGTLDYGIYHSTDGGQTWLPSSNYNTVHATSMTVKDPYVFAETIQGVLRSSDNGITWQVVPHYFTPGYAMCSTGDKLIAADNSGQTYFSTDYGASWYTIESLDGALIWSFYVKGDTVYAGGINKIYRSTDDGVTFIEIAVPFNYSTVIIHSIVSIGQTLFMGTSYGGVYNSTDNGSTWSPSNTGMGPKNIFTLAVTQSSFLAAGAYTAGFYKSTDNGLNWNKSLTGFPAGSFIWSMCNSDHGLLAGTGDGLYKTTDNGTSWEKLTGASDTINYGVVYGIAARNQEIYTAITYQFNGIVYKSTDSGETWTRSGNGFASDIQYMRSIAVSGNNIVAGSDQGLYYSTDDGNTWILSNQTVGFFEEIAATPNYLYATAPGNGIYRSSNEGITWTTAFNVPFSFSGITAMDNYAYAGSGTGGAFYSNDNGNIWDSVSFQYNVRVYTMEYIPAVPGMALAGTDDQSSHIYASFNYSHSFSPYSDGLDAAATPRSLSSNDTYTFYGTDYTGVWRRFLPGITPVELTSFKAIIDKNNVELKWQTETEKNNSGFEVQKRKLVDRNQKSEWKKIGLVEGQGTSTTLNYYSFNDKDIPPGQYQYRLKQIDYDGSFKYSDIADVNIMGPTEFSLEQNYPNPFNPSTTIKYSIAKAGKVSLQVFNILGEEIVDLVNDYKEAGNYEVNFNAEKLSSGIYYYRLRSGRYTSVKKMILLK